MSITLTTFSGTVPPWSLAALDANFAALAGAVGGGGVYEAPFQSGSIQVLAADGQSITGFGNLQWGFQLPNASGIPSQGILVGGAGASQVVYITDQQLGGQKGITVIREAGDANVTPGSDDGGDLLDFAGASITGGGGTAKYQAGTSVHGRAGDAILHGGNSTDGITGDAVVIGGETGSTGGNVLLIMTKPPGSSTFGALRIIAGNGNFPSGSSVELMQLTSNGEIFLTHSGTGYGLAGQCLVSNGPGLPVQWKTAFTGDIPIPGSGITLHVASGLITGFN